MVYFNINQKTLSKFDKFCSVVFMNTSAIIDLLNSYNLEQFYVDPKVRTSQMLFRNIF